MKNHPINQKVLKRINKNHRERNDAMKRLLTFFMMLTVLTGCSAGTPQEESGPVPQLTLADLTKLNGGTPPEIEYRDNGYPEHITGIVADFPVLTEEDACRAVRELSDLLGISDFDNELILAPAYGAAYTVYPFYQYHEGMRVMGSVIMLYADQESGAPYYLFSSFIPDLTLDIEPVIDAESAAAIVEETYPYVAVSGEPVLMILSRDGQVNLVWDIRTHSSDPDEVYLDAHTGEVLYTNTEETDG